MKIKRYLIASIASVLAASAWADPAPRILNLSLPPAHLTAENTNTTPVTGTSELAPKAITTQAATSIASATSSRAPVSLHYDAAANAIVDAADSHKPACDDSSYGKPQVHGDIGMGVVAGSHVSGNYQTGTLNITKATGSCDHPTGGIGLSISVGRGNFNDRGRGGRHW
ncbi:MAG: hypothetical protein ABI304_01210 [Rudaea sp.]